MGFGRVRQGALLLCPAVYRHENRMHYVCLTMAASRIRRVAITVRRPAGRQEVIHGCWPSPTPFPVRSRTYVACMHAIHDTSSPTAMCRRREHESAVAHFVSSSSALRHAIPHLAACRASGSFKTADRLHYVDGLLLTQAPHPFELHALIMCW